MKTRTIHIRVTDAEYARLSTLSEPFGSISGYVRDCLDLEELKNGRPSSKKKKVWPPETSGKECGKEVKLRTARETLHQAEAKQGLR